MQTIPSSRRDALVDAPVQLGVVRRWRRDQLVRAGCPWREATLLSGLANVDLHTAEDLFAHGCPVETALRILL